MGDRLDRERSGHWINRIEDGVPEGSRHDSAVRLVGWWYAVGLTASDVRERLIFWNERNMPPLGRDEIESILKSTEKWELPPGALTFIDKRINRWLSTFNKNNQKRR
jgi:hypothetical protein